MFASRYKTEEMNECRDLYLIEIVPPSMWKPGIVAEGTSKQILPIFNNIRLPTSFIIVILTAGQNSYYVLVSGMVMSSKYSTVS